MAEKKTPNEASSSGANIRGVSVVADVGRRRSSCGYCKSGAHTSITFGLWAHSLTVDDYQALLDRGWRRSGSFLYKPEMETTCCPSYTIRLKAKDFVPSREQLRVSKKMQRFLDGMLNAKETNEVMDCLDNSNCSNNEIASSAATQSLVCNHEKKNNDEQLMCYLSDQIENVVGACIKTWEFASDFQCPKASVRRVTQAKRKLLVEGSEELLFTCNVAFLIAAALRREKKKDVYHLKENGQSLEGSPNLIAVKLVESLSELAESSGLSIRACNGHINFYSAKKQASSGEVVDKSSTFAKEPTTRIGSQDSCLNKISKRPRIKRQTLEIRLKESSFDPEEYSLYRRYQMKVHNDKPDQVSESSYRRFLVDTPLVFVPSTGDGTVPPCGFGSFHQQYVVDGRVVAVGVIDILPKCLSSKYLFWDPDLDFLSLGKYSALQEISWVKENQVHCPSLQYYYLGYYIHSCKKMTYKAAYRPSELLCPLRYEWVPFDVARPLLDRKPYVILSDYSALQNEESSVHNDLDNHMDVQDNFPGQEDSNGVPVEDDKDMDPFRFDDSEDLDSLDESDPETNGLTSTENRGDISNILIELQESRIKYKDLEALLKPHEREYLENQVHRFARAVGPEVVERMVYALR